MALAVRVVTALPLTQPGYMDAYYYYNAAEGLYHGRGLTDPYLWNFLDHPTRIPHPAYSYWMPFTSFLIYPFFLLLGESFRAAQIPFVFLSAFLALIAYRVSLDCSGDRRQATITALLIVFSGYYLVFWVVPDTFAPFAVVGSLALYSASRHMNTRGVLWPGLAGLCAGLANLTRADGSLVLMAIFIALSIYALRTRPPLLKVLASTALCLGTYSLIMVPWFCRNLETIGQPLATGGLQTLFLRDYDELFSFGRSLTLQSYLDWGWAAILRSKLQGLGFGLVNLIAVNLLLFLAPLAGVGLWVWRKRLELLPVVVYALLLYGSMTIGFTYPGIRGGLFHSSAVLLPWLSAAAVAGLDPLLGRIGTQRPAWNVAQAHSTFGWALVFLAMLVSGFLYLRGVLGWQTGVPWNARGAVYMEVGQWLSQQPDGTMRVMVNNAPGFYYYTQHECLSIPNEPLPVVLDTARRFRVRYLVLESDHPRPLEALYRNGPGDAPLELALELQKEEPWGSQSFLKVYRLK